MCNETNETRLYDCVQCQCLNTDWYCKTMSISMSIYVLYTYRFAPKIIVWLGRGGATPPVRWKRPSTWAEVEPDESTPWWVPLTRQHVHRPRQRHILPGSLSPECGCLDTWHKNQSAGENRWNSFFIHPLANGLCNLEKISSTWTIISKKYQSFLQSSSRQ